MSMKRTIVFDLDGTLETPYFDKTKKSSVKKWMTKHPCGGTFEDMYAEVLDGMPHFLLAGALELLRWVHAKGFEIVFFSNAVRARNEELCPILMERAFGKGKEPPYRIFSRPDCINTQYFHNEEESRTYEGIWFGNYKKKLANVVVTPEDLPNTLMIEDDNSYACRGEEANFVYGVYGGSANDFIESRDYRHHKGKDFYLPFYFCAMLKRIVDWSENTGCSLREAAVRIQYSDQGLLFPVDGQDFVTTAGDRIEAPKAPIGKFRTYVEGLKELRTINPELKFWGDVDEKGWSWPEPKDPPPPPPPPKPKSEIGMREDEVLWRLQLIRDTLRSITESNVKGISLCGEGVGDYRQVLLGESECDDLSVSSKFDRDERIDLSKVTSVRLYGYLPIKPQEHDYGKNAALIDCYDLIDRRESVFKTFRRVLERMLEELFAVSIRCSEIDTGDGEHWTIPCKSYWKDSQGR